MINFSKLFEDFSLFSWTHSRPLVSFDWCLSFHLSLILHSRACSRLRLLISILGCLCLLLGSSFGLALSKQLYSSPQSLLLCQLTLWSLSTPLPDLLSKFHNLGVNSSLISLFLGCKVSLSNTLLNLLCSLFFITFLPRNVEGGVVMDIGRCVFFVFLLFCNFLLIFNLDLLLRLLCWHLKLFLRLISFLSLHKFS